jgi:hypothetical protein
MLDDIGGGAGAGAKKTGNPISAITPLSRTGPSEILLLPALSAES